MKTEKEMLSTLAKYCSIAERCEQDLRKKIKAAELPIDAEKRIIEYLKKENYLNEERYCRSFVNDKFRFNNWGRIKICYELKQKGIKSEMYYEAIDTIDEEEYEQKLESLLKAKKRTTKGNSPQDIFQKLCRFASSRGFETPLIMQTLKKIINNNNYDSDY